MKKYILILLLCISLIFADDLPDYVAQFDKNLAIELYKKEIEDGNDLSGTYRALAELYNTTGKTELAEDCYRHLIVIHKESENIYRLYLDFLYENGSYAKVRHIIFEKGYKDDWSDYLAARSYFHESKFDSSLKISKNLPAELAGRLYSFSLEGTEQKYRSPALGGIMSAIIPGSGKIYAGRLLDGIQAFSVVAAPAYNAYYHFRKTGSGSVQAWIWTAVASWFYLSDIYGSVKSVKEYNEMMKLGLIERYGQ